VKDLKLTEHFWKTQVILWFRVRLKNLRAIAMLTAKLPS